MELYKHTYMIITTTFPLEPLLQEYMEKYPDGTFQQFEVVFKVQGEFQDYEGDLSYIIVFIPNENPPKQGTGFSEILDAFCKLNKEAAIAASTNSIFPHFQIRPYGHVYGDWEATLKK